MSYSLALFFQLMLKSYIYIILIPSKLLDNNKIFSLKSIISLLLFAFALTCTNGINVIIKTVLTILINFLIIKTIYNNGNVISIILGVISFTLVFICDEVTEIIFSELFNVDMLYIKYYPANVILIGVISFIFAYLITRLLNAKSFIEEIKDYSFERKNMNIICVYIILSIVFLSLICHSIKNEILFSEKYVIGVILFLTYVVISIVYLFQIKELIKSKNDYDTIYNYISNVEKVAGQLKKQEHEHNNQLIAIKAFANENKADEIIEFIDNIIKNKIKNKISANVGLELIQDSILKTLLVHKINGAAGFGVRVEAFIRSEIGPFNISPKEMTNIIGIIMDNAIEGAVDSDEKYISILIDEDEDSEEINITISNTYKNVPKIYENGVSTKGEYRGNGLSILMDIEEENENIKISTELTEELFIQDIFIKK